MNIKLRKQYAGLGLIGWIIAIPLVIIFLLILTVGFYEGRKAYWDHKVTEMCKKDGGVTVFEKVVLSKEEYQNQSGATGKIIAPPFSESSTGKYLFFSKYEKSIIKKSNPEVFKRVTYIYRYADNKPLGKMIHYRRVGGDFPTIILHPSGFGCDDTTNLRSLLDKIFFVKGD